MNRTDHRWYRLLVAFLAVKLLCLPTGCQSFRKAKPVEPVPVYESPSTQVDQASHENGLRLDENGNPLPSNDPNAPPPVENIQTPPPTTLMKVRKTVVDGGVAVGKAVMLCFAFLGIIILEIVTDDDDDTCVYGHPTN